MARAYWNGRIQRPFLTPKPAELYADYAAKQWWPERATGPIELNPQRKRYGLLKKPYYYLVLNGGEAKNAVIFKVDEETATIYMDTVQ